MSSGRPLKVRPGAGGEGWDVVLPVTREVVDHRETQAGAVQRAVELSPTGGGIEVLNRDGFIIGHQSVPAPPHPPRRVMLELAARVAFAAAIAIPLCWLFHSPVPAGAFIGGCLAAVVTAVRRLRAARRAPAATEGSRG